MALCRMISYNIGQLAYMNAKRFGLKRVFFGGFFIRGHPYTMDTISFAIRFWSQVRRVAVAAAGAPAGGWLRARAAARPRVPARRFCRSCCKNSLSFFSFLFPRHLGSVTTENETSKRIVFVLPAVPHPTLDPPRPNPKPPTPTPFRAR
jgi:hypothetical protein